MPKTNRKELEKKKTVTTQKKTPKTKKKFFGGSEIIQSIRGQVKLDANIFFELYKRNPDIRQSINKISLAVAKNGLIVKNKKGDIIEDPKIDMELESTFEMPTFQKFKKELFKQYLISGELYIADMRNLKDELAGFQILDSRSMTKQIGQTGDIIGFTQRTSTGLSRKFTREELAFYKFENDVDNENNGMGLLEGIVWDTLSDLKGSEKNYYVIENDSMPGGMIMLDESMSQEEQQNAIAQISAQHKGASNTNKLMVAGGVKDIKQMYISNKDLDWINQRKLTTDKVSASLGVPKNILGYTDDINLANGKELRQEYIEGTIRPLQNDFDFILNSLLAKFEPKKAALYTVASDGESLEDREKLETSQRENLKLGLQTIDEIRNERKLDPFNTDQSSKPLIQNNMIMLEDMIMDQEVNLSEM